MAALSGRLENTVAPDVARFDRRRRVKQAYAQEQALREKTAARPKAVSRADGQARPSLFVVAVFFAAFLLLFLIVYSYMTLSVLNSQNESMKRELAKVTNENAMLQKEYENKVTLSEVADIATTQLGMVVPDRSQVNYIDLSGEDMSIVIQKESPFARVLDSIMEKIDGLLAYLG